MHKLLDLDLNNKNLTIRVDMNVPIKNGIIVDQTRIEACIPTIQKALDNNANVLLVSHLGRPEEGSMIKIFLYNQLQNPYQKFLDLQ